MVLAFSAPTDGPAQTFDDVPTDHWAYSFIETIAANGITAGCGNDNYCPEASVTRAQMAVFLERGMRGSGFTPPAATGNVFLDVGANDFAANFIEQFFLEGITAGCGGNNFCPNDTVTRAQMAVFLLRAKFGPGYSPPPAVGIFADAPLGSFAVAWIEQLSAEGITAGCGVVAVIPLRFFDLVTSPEDLDFPAYVLIRLRWQSLRALVRVHSARSRRPAVPVARHRDLAARR